MDDNKNQQLLDTYYYKNGNSNDKGNAILKILVGYIKPSFLFKSNILTPIHLGRAIAKEYSKDGVVSEDDYNWLLSNCIGDNDFEKNISHFNRRVGFLTGTYWAWKNYEKLGSPDYFGSFGYRRLLKPVFLENINYYDIIIPKDKILQDNTVKQQFIDIHGSNAFNTSLNVLLSLYPSEIKYIDEYFNSPQGYYDEIYIFKKDIFFEFCEWIFPILFELLKLDYKNFEATEEEKQKIIAYYYRKNLEFFCNEQNFNVYQQRNIGFIMERFTGYYIYKLLKKHNVKYFKTETIFIEKLKQLKIQQKCRIQKLRQNALKSFKK